MHTSYNRVKGRSSYKRVKGRSHTAEKRVSMLPHKPHANSQPCKLVTSSMKHLQVACASAIASIAELDKPNMSHAVLVPRTGTRHQLQVLPDAPGVRTRRHLMRVHARRSWNSTPKYDLFKLAKWRFRHLTRTERVYIWRRRARVLCRHACGFYVAECGVGCKLTAQHLTCVAKYMAYSASSSA